MEKARTLFEEHLGEIAAGIRELCVVSHTTASENGFWDDKPPEGYNERAKYAAMKLMLVVSELGEAVEALRKGDRENYNEELADVMIRVADLVGVGDPDSFAVTLVNKLRTNLDRPRKHGKAF